MSTIIVYFAALLMVVVLAINNICFKRLRRDFKIIENRNKELEAENLKLKYKIELLEDLIERVEDAEQQNDPNCHVILY